MVGEKTNPISRSCVNGGANPHLILLGVIFGGLDFNNTLWVLKDSGQALNENGLKMNRKLAVFCESDHPYVVISISHARNVSCKVLGFMLYAKVNLSMPCLLLMVVLFC